MKSNSKESHLLSATAWTLPILTLVCRYVYRELSISLLYPTRLFQSNSDFSASCVQIVKARVGGLEVLEMLLVAQEAGFTTGRCCSYKANNFL